MILDYLSPMTDTNMLTGITAMMAEGSSGSQFDLETAIIVAEVNSAADPKNANAHYLLADLYLRLPEELSEDSKLQIHEGDFREISSAYVRDLKSQDAKEDYIARSNNPDATRMRLCSDWVANWSADLYLNFDNIHRATSHYTAAVKIDPQNNLANLLFLKFIGDKRVDPAGIELISNLTQPYRNANTSKHQAI